MIKGLVSIIVPIYNAENYLEECVNSILKQVYFSYEIILVDDGSTDRSKEIIEKYIRDFSHIKAIKQKNGGPNSARIKGLSIATGEYVMFVDADDFVDELICERLVQVMEVQAVDVVISKPVKIFAGERIGRVGNWKEGKYRGTYLAENVISQDIFEITQISMGLYAILFKTSLINKILPQIDSRIMYAEDYTCLLLVLLEANFVYYLEDALYFYRQSNDSITHKHAKSHLESQKWMYKFLVLELEKRQVSTIVYKQLEWMIFKYLLSGGYEIFKEKDYLFPFKIVEKNSDIIIYGAGVWGGELYRFVKQFYFCNVVLWVDQRYEIYQKMGMPVEKVEEIKKVEYDYIVISILNTNISRRVKIELEKMGVSSNKIAIIDQELITYKELPEEFWI